MWAPGHTIRDCEDIQYDDDGKEELQSNYGSWLRTSPLKKNSTTLSGKHNIELKKKLVFKRGSEGSPSDISESYGNRRDDAVRDHCARHPTGLDANGDGYRTDEVNGYFSDKVDNYVSRSNLRHTHMMGLMLFGLSNYSIVASKETCALLKIRQFSSSGNTCLTEDKQEEAYSRRNASNTPYFPITHGTHSHVIIGDANKGCLSDTTKQSSGTGWDKEIVGHDNKEIPCIDYASGSGTDMNNIHLEVSSSVGILCHSTEANNVGVQCWRVIHVHKHGKKDSIVGTDMLFDVLAGNIIFITSGSKQETK